MKYNLSKRIFVITLSILLLLMAFTFIFQLIFFEDFYEGKKEESLTTELTRFSNIYSYQLNSTNEIKNALFSFENKTNAKIAIFSYNNGNIELKYVITNMLNDREIEYSLTAYCDEISSNTELIDKVMKNNTAESTIFYNQSSNTKKIGVITPISLNNYNDGLAIAVSSIQPIEEAASVIAEFYIYIFISFIFISILLSLIYTNLISKPLVKINNVAKKMSNMDFSQKCESDRHDEIGNLANTLNFLSTNLEQSLKDLQEKNKKLQLDIEKERNLELMRKDFVASVSHELKTPIGIIEGYAEGIKDGIVSSKDALEYLETIIDESKKMGVLVSNMLELSKLESGVLKPKPEIFNINRLIKKVVSTLTINSEEKGLNLSFIEKTDYSYIEADVFQMEQVLTNLITNAIKYTPAGNNINVSIGIENNLYKISVINYGVQINEYEIDKLFNKFYRVDKARERKNNSTGLGLSIVKNILELHNFEYLLHNIDNGVEFVYYIPIQTIEDEI